MREGSHFLIRAACCKSLCVLRIVKVFSITLGEPEALDYLFTKVDSQSEMPFYFVNFCFVSPSIFCQFLFCYFDVLCYFYHFLFHLAISILLNVQLN